MQRGNKFQKDARILQKDTLEKVSMKNFVKYALTTFLANDIM